MMAACILVFLQQWTITGDVVLYVFVITLAIYIFMWGNTATGICQGGPKQALYS